MQNNTERRFEQALVEDKAVTRARAEAVLRSLEAARDECRARLREENRTDAMEAVTGESSLDRAVDATRRMVEGMGPGGRATA
ncbi:MAG: hypothetical protein AAGB34_10285 [Planctomycetota bacterium]